MARIELINLRKTLKESQRAVGGLPLLTGIGSRSSVFTIHDLNLTIPDGKTAVVLGPSGCGKTTLLRMIAGLIPPDSGMIRYDGVNMNDVPPGGRRLGMVFQNYALYPHLDSRTNVLSYFHFRKKTPELSAMATAKYQRTSELMGVELEYLLDRRPTKLSGGEKQRVALGRCITRDPALFLLDEPFSNLDQALREKYRVNLKLLLRQFGITTVYVTHDHYEAMILADLLVIMNGGHIEQVGTYEGIYDQPESIFVAGFLNRHIGAPPISFLDAQYLEQIPAHAQIGVRPEDVAVSGEQQPGSIEGRIVGRLALPMLNATILSIQVGEHEVYALKPIDESVPAGARVWLTLKRYHVFDSASGRRLRRT
jgi:ABC-type sugar transport system ATPase subunit